MKFLEYLIVFILSFFILGSINLVTIGLGETSIVENLILSSVVLLTCIERDLSSRINSVRVRFLVDFVSLFGASTFIVFIGKEFFNYVKPDNVFIFGFVVSGMIVIVRSFMGFYSEFNQEEN